MPEKKQVRVVNNSINPIITGPAVHVSRSGRGRIRSWPEELSEYVTSASFLAEISEVTPQIICFHYLKKQFLDRSIQKYI